MDETFATRISKWFSHTSASSQRAAVSSVSGNSLGTNLSRSNTPRENSSSANASSEQFSRSNSNSISRKQCQTIIPSQAADHISSQAPDLMPSTMSDRFSNLKMTSATFCESNVNLAESHPVHCQMSAAPALDSRDGWMSSVNDVSLDVLTDVRQDVITDVGIDTGAVDTAFTTFRHRMRRWVRGEGPHDGAIAGVNAGHAVSAAVGGPLVIYGYTPLRNAMTLGAQDTTSSALRLYGQLYDFNLLFQVQFDSSCGSSLLNLNDSLLPCEILNLKHHLAACSKIKILMPFHSKF